MSASLSRSCTTQVRTQIGYQEYCIRFTIGSRKAWVVNRHEENQKHACGHGDRSSCPAQVSRSPKWDPKRQQRQSRKSLSLLYARNANWPTDGHECPVLKKPPRLLLSPGAGSAAAYSADGDSGSSLPTPEPAPPKTERFVMPSVDVCIQRKEAKNEEEMRAREKNAQQQDDSSQDVDVAIDLADSSEDDW